VAELQSSKTKLSGVCCALPGEGRSIHEIGASYFDEETIRKTCAPIGVETIYTAPEGTKASDLCAAAAERLISGLGWNPSDIGALIFISQTPDFQMPATSGILQDRLGLSEGCLTYDVNLGCSAFVNGYFLAASLIEAGAAGKVLLLIGDTLRRHVAPDDKGLTFIISDAGSATAFERSGQAGRTSFLMKGDGSGFGSLIIREGESMFMDGMGVFTFAVKQVPVLLAELAALHGAALAGTDLFLFHQANAYMLKYIAKRAGIPMDSVPVNIGRYGNTNGSTIPFLLADLAADGGLDGRNVMMAGFGVGLSWGGVATGLHGIEWAGVITV
jgi:3-oxoacyl-[acyl-carrier-protein] synthase-3